MARNRIYNKNVFITGASRGIGAEIAKKCGEKGARLFLFARNGGLLQQLKEKIEMEHGAEVFIYKLDVSKPDEIEKVFAKALADGGGIDVLVNNAGFGVFRKAEEVNIEEAREMFLVNVVGLIACTTAVLPKFIEQRRGHIINIASQAGKIATPKSSVYSSTKHAVLGYTNSLRMELSDYNIFVTAVNPGPIATDFFNTADVSGTYVKNVEKFMLKPEAVADEIVRKMLVPAREINLPRWMNAGSLIYSLFPRLFEKAGKKFLNRK